MPLSTVPSGNKTANDPITILPHGDSKVGKTTFASTFPEPLIGDLENGSQFLTRNVDTVPWIDFPLFWAEKSVHLYNTVLYVVLHIVSRVIMCRSKYFLGDTNVG